MAKGMKGAILIGILLTTAIGIPMGVTSTDIAAFARPDISPTFMKMDLAGLLAIGEAGITGALTSVLL